MKITIAIPYSSNLTLLKKAVESVLLQDSKNWEMLVCSDQQNDEDARAWISTLQAQGHPIQYYKNTPALGMPLNFNRCIKLAKTDWVTLLHDDDELMPNYVSSLSLSIAEHQDVAALFTRGIIINEEGKKIFSLPDQTKELIRPHKRKKLILHGDWGLSKLLIGNFILPPSLCFNKKIITQNPFSTECGWFVVDWDFTCRLLLENKTLIGLPERLVRYRRRSGNTTSRMLKDFSRFQEELQLVKKISKICKERGWVRSSRAARLSPILRMHLVLKVLEHTFSGKMKSARRGAALLVGDIK